MAQDLEVARLQADMSPPRPLPDGWRWARLGDITNVVGGTTPDSTRSELWNGDIVWVTPTDLGKLREPFIRGSDRCISEAGFKSGNLTLVPEGTVILSSRAPIGHLGIAAVPLCTNQGCKSFIPGPDVISQFLYYAPKAAFSRNQSSRMKTWRSSGSMVLQPKPYSGERHGTIHREAQGQDRGCAGML